MQTHALCRPLAAPIARALVETGGTAAPTAPVAGMLLWLDAATAAAVGNGNEVVNWTDSSGNGHDAQSGGTGPDYIVSSINALPAMRFDGNRRLVTSNTCSVTANAHTGFIVAKTSAFSGSQQSLFSWQSNAHFLVVHNGVAGGCNICLFDGNGLHGYMFFPLNTAVILSWESKAGSFRFKVNGLSIYATAVEATALLGLGPAVSLGGAAINTANIGANQFGQGYSGDIAEVLVYDSNLSDSDIASNEAYLAAKYGITMLSNLSASKTVVLLGDSRSVETNAGQSGASATISSLRNALGLDWFAISAGVSGNTPAQMAARVSTDVAPYYKSSGTKNICVVWGAANALSGSSAATIYADLLTCCANARSAGFKVILCTEIQSTSYDGTTNAKRVTLNGLIDATSVPGTVDAICDLDAALGAGQPLHPDTASGVILAVAMSAAINSL